MNQNYLPLFEGSLMYFIFDKLFYPVFCFGQRLYLITDSLKCILDFPGNPLPSGFLFLAFPALRLFFCALFFLLLLFSRRRPLGEFLFEQFDFKVVQTWLGCVIAATVIAFPLMYRNARAAMEQIDMNLVYAGRTLGMSDTKIFWTVIVPTAGPGIASGTILTFARALGEYGATSMLAGNIPGKTGTISQKIAMVIQDGDYLTAGIWVAVVMIIAFLVIFLMNLISGKKMKHIGRW